MQSRLQHIVITAVALFCAGAHALAAQDGSTRLSVDGAVGGGHSWRGGERVERGLIATDLVVAMQIAGHTHQGFLIGFEAGRYLQMNGDLLCVTQPDGRCVPQYPGFDALSVVGGPQWQWSPALRVRVLAGPGYYTAHFDHNSTTSHSLGVGARADVGVHIYSYLFATVAARGGWVPRVRGQSYVPSAVMIGLRLDTGR